MAIGIATAVQKRGLNKFTVCPNWDEASKACTCLVRQVPDLDAEGQPVIDEATRQPVLVDDSSGELAIPHQTFNFVAEIPDGDTRSATEWAAAGATEALRIVEAQQAPEDVQVLPAIVANILEAADTADMASLVGQTVN